VCRLRHDAVAQNCLGTGEGGSDSYPGTLCSDCVVRCNRHIPGRTICCAAIQQQGYHCPWQARLPAAKRPVLMPTSGQCGGPCPDASTGHRCAAWGSGVRFEPGHDHPGTRPISMGTRPIGARVRAGLPGRVAETTESHSLQCLLYYTICNTSIILQSVSYIQHNRTVHNTSSRSLFSSIVIVW
jgi:hypothetical protein